MLIAAGDPGVRELHGGVQPGGAVRGGGVKIEGRLPRDGVRHWAREL
jgi:hypothetical protein